MSIGFSWKASELKMTWTDTDIFSKQAVECLKICHPLSDNGMEIDHLDEYLEEQYSLTITPSSSNVYIADKEYIESCDDFHAFIRHYQRKYLHDQMAIVYVNGESLDVDVISFPKAALENYRKMLGRVVINVDSPGSEVPYVSPEIFEEISKRTLKEESASFSYVKNFLSLLLIADAVWSVGDNPNNFLFQLSFSDEGSIINHAWKDMEHFKNGFWYDCYSWITSPDFSTFDGLTKRGIVKAFINLKGYHFWESYSAQGRQDLFKSLDQILSRIIHDKTKEYFEIQNQLKSQYIDIYTKSAELKNRLMNTTLSLPISAIAGFLTLFYKDGDLAWVEDRFILIIATSLYTVMGVAILIWSLMGVRSHNQYRSGILNIYEKKLHFGKLDKNIFPKLRYSALLVPLLFQIILTLASSVLCTLLCLGWLGGT